jgi:hypothetical protein
MSEHRDNDFNENEEEYNGLTLQQKLILEDLIVETAFNNSFMLITKRKTFEEILDMKAVDGNSAVMAHTPEEEMPIESLENMMAYFVETEEYEKCAEIRDIIIDRQLKEELDVYIQS